MNYDEPFQTLAGLGESELVVERSRFFGQALPVASLEEALEYVEAVRSEHYDARHVCFGLRIGRGAQGIDRSNDDGEPSRTGGFPLWQILDGEEVTDALIVVVRYYGGVKLGTGGLARAYRGAGRAAFDAAGISTVYPSVRVPVTVPYDQVGRLEHLLKDFEGVTVSDKQYAADVTFHLDVWRIRLNALQQALGALLQRDPATFEPTD